MIEIEMTESHWKLFQAFMKKHGFTNHEDAMRHLMAVGDKMTPTEHKMMQAIGDLPEETQEAYDAALLRGRRK